MVKVTKKSHPRLSVTVEEDINIRYQSIEATIEELNLLIEKYPKEQGWVGVMYIDAGDFYGSMEYTTQVHFSRPETDEEWDARRAKIQKELNDMEKEEKPKREEKEKKELARLLKKYGDITAQKLGT